MVKPFWAENFLPTQKNQRVCKKGYQMILLIFDFGDRYLFLDNYCLNSYGGVSSNLYRLIDKNAAICL